MKLHPPFSLFRRAASSAVLLSWMVTGLRLGNVMLLLPVMLRTLPPEELGLWFVLLSFTQFFTLVEMGLQSTLVRSAAYLFAGAREIAAFGIETPSGMVDGPNWNELRRLLLTGSRLYLRLAVLAGLLTLAIGGGWLAYSRPDEFLRPAPLATFGLLFLSGPLALAGMHWNAFLAGLNRVREAQAIQFRAVAANYAVSLGGLLVGWGMIALALGQAIMVLVSRWESRRLVLRHFPELHDPSPASELPWRRLWPMAWRSGAVSISSYFALPASLIVCGQTLDLRTTASFGLSMQAALLLHGVAANWLAVKYPLFSQWFAAARLEEARAMFRTRAAASMLTFIAGAGGALILGSTVLRLLGSKTAFLPTGIFAALLAVVGLDLLVALHSSLLLTANRADHLPALAVTGLLSVPFGWWGASIAGVPGLVSAMAVAYFVAHAWRTPFLTWQFLRGRSIATEAALAE